MLSLSHQKGVKHAVDDFCNSLNFVAAGIDQWLHDWRIRSRPAGHRHRCGADPSYSGTKTLVAVSILVGESEVFGKEMVSRYYPKPMSQASFILDFSLKVQ